MTRKNEQERFMSYITDKGGKTKRVNMWSV